MSIRIYFSVVFCFLANLLFAQYGATGSWRNYMPTHKAIAVAQGNNKVFTATQNEVIVYDINDESLSYLQKGRELTEINISHINYNEEKNILIIGYNSGNIDLIIDERTINLPALKNATIIGNKKIANAGKLIVSLINYQYLYSTGLGVIQLSSEYFFLH